MKYDSFFIPAAPIGKVQIFSPFSVTFEKSDASTVTVNMLLDTGSDVSFIPKKAVSILEQRIGTRLPYGSKTIEDFRGRISRHPKISFFLKFSDFLTEEFEFVVLNQKYGIIGRDILNQLTITFNGPELNYAILRSN